MATGIVPPHSRLVTALEPHEPDRRSIGIALGIALVFVSLTRLPIARIEPFDSDEFGFLDQIAVHWFPMHHTLFMTIGRIFGLMLGDSYRGFVLLDALTSAIALLSVWWWLRAISPPATAAAGALVVGVAPVFWGYGAMAANYTAIVAVGCFLLGIAYRGRIGPRAWHPYAAAVALAAGTGYRQDIGTLWLPVFAVILWQNRWKPAMFACLIFTLLNLAWLTAMLYEAGGWRSYRAQSAEFAYQCGYLNSVWNLGVVDGTLRYALKLGMALLWTLGPALMFVPRGLSRLRAVENGWFIVVLASISIFPALASHMIIHFGVAGYGFHYLPALIALVAVGVGGFPAQSTATRSAAHCRIGWMRGPAVRLIAIAGVLATLFWCYPTDYTHPGWRGSFDLAFCRFTRTGLRMPLPDHAPLYWRTANSRPMAGRDASRPREAAAGSG